MNSGKVGVRVGRVGFVSLSKSIIVFGLCLRNKDFILGLKKSRAVFGLEPTLPPSQKHN